MAQPTNDDLEKNGLDNSDDLFTSGDDNEKTNDSFGNIPEMANVDEGRLSPELSNIESDSPEITDLNDLSTEDSFAASSEETVEPTVDEEGKKIKTPKAKKEKKVRVKKEKKRILDLEKLRIPGGRSIVVLACFLLALLVIGNIMAFVSYGMSALMFMIIYSILGLVALCVPFLLWRKRRNEEFINLYDVLLGCALIFVVLACMVVLIAQSQKYGSSIKGSARADSVRIIC